MESIRKEFSRHEGLSRREETKLELTPERTVRRALLRVKSKARVRNHGSDSAADERSDLRDLTLREHVCWGIVNVESWKS